jgi:hypothetical protein
MPQSIGTGSLRLDPACRASRRAAPARVGHAGRTEPCVPGWRVPEGTGYRPPTPGLSTMLSSRARATAASLVAVSSGWKRLCRSPSRFKGRLVHPRTTVVRPTKPRRSTGHSLPVSSGRPEIGATAICTVCRQRDPASGEVCPVPVALADRSGASASLSAGEPGPTPEVDHRERARVVPGYGSLSGSVRG